MLDWEAGALVITRSANIESGEKEILGRDGTRLINEKKNDLSDVCRLRGAPKGGKVPGRHATLRLMGVAERVGVIGFRRSKSEGEA